MHPAQDFPGQWDNDEGHEIKLDIEIEAEFARRPTNYESYRGDGNNHTVGKQKYMEGSFLHHWLNHNADHRLKEFNGLHGLLICEIP